MPQRLITGPDENALAATQIGADSGLDASVTFDVDAPDADRVLVQVENLGGSSVAATSGCRVRAYRRVGRHDALETDSVAAVDVVLETVDSTSRWRTFDLPGGNWRFELENLDTTAAEENAITVSANVTRVEQAC